VADNKIASKKQSYFSLGKMMGDCNESAVIEMYKTETEISQKRKVSLYLVEQAMIAGGMVAASQV
jgi:hypothetical protein